MTGRYLSAVPLFAAPKATSPHWVTTTCDWTTKSSTV